MDQYLWILILVLSVAPFVLLLWGLRRFGRWRQARAEKARREAEERAARAAQMAAGAAPQETAPPSPALHIEGGTLLGLYVIYFLLLFGVFLSRLRWWGYLLLALYWALWGFSLWNALSRGEYERIRAKDSAVTRRQFVIFWLMLTVIPPLVPWLLFGFSVLWRALCS
ncbi:MAG: hypothetical protein HY656_02985 [Acidobacteria bacterium]|nr:hypothetical protein [Acidobacteriota bacterium]